jgi:hypothetical protein
MIDRKPLLDDLKKLVTKVEADLLARSEDQNVPEIGARLTSEYDRARAARRTAATYEEWRTDRITQAAVAWVLSCVFVRFLEDNDLITPPRIAGPGDRLSTARDSHQHFFSSHPRETDRDFLLSIFDELAALPGTADIFGGHNALREIPTWLSGDAAKDIIQFFQKIDANTGTLIHDFTQGTGSFCEAKGACPPPYDTRFLGDLYQDLSAFARERYALLQTPHFVEQFLLDRTLEPALDEFGLTEAFKMIDPACGSGHLVLGCFARILDRWQRQEPATPVRELVRRSLAAVHGVDINPFAVAIARFRLLLVAMRACDVAKLSDAPVFHLNIECGDSLLHTPLIGGVVELFDKHEKGPTDDECDHAYASEDLAAIKKLLRHGQYHAVMANPPYITPKDPGLRDRYRDRFATCHMKYSLAVPFMEHIFKLCVPGGFTGQITANSFMKREFGKKLIEKFFPVTDLTHVIDTSGAYIPGHGTPTVILFGRQRRPVSDTVRAVMGIRGEPTTPDEPARGLVWTAITTQVDQPGSKSEFVSVADTPRGTFHAHPWSMGGGGAAELKEMLEASCDPLLKAATSEIGIIGMTNADDVMLAPLDAFRRSRVEPNAFRRLALGDEIRDWAFHAGDYSLFPYCDGVLKSLSELPYFHRWLWGCRTVLGNRATFAQLTYFKEGRPWWEWHQLTAARLRTPLSITFGEVATHNHFVLDRGGKVFNRTAPVIKLAPEATENDHLALLGILNSSTACFWLKQVCFPKGGDHVGTEGARVRRSLWDERYAFNSTNIEGLPLPASRPLDLARDLQTASDTQATLTPSAAIARWAVGAAADPPPSIWPTLKRALENAAGESDAIRRHRIALQEELDWQCYSLYGLLDADLEYGKPVPPIRLGERAFEIALARRVAAGDTTTTWFERHGSAPITEIPAHWPADYRALVQRRLDAIANNQNIRLIEQPEYKRRWSTEPWADQQTAALKSFLLDRLERLCDFDGRMNDAGTPTATLPPALVSLGEVATAARRDPLFMEAAEVFTGDVAFDPLALVTSLVADESVPLLPSFRYKDSGLRKRREWERVWDLQRKEDAIDARTALDPKHPQHLTQEQAQQQKQQQVGDIAVPPKYTSPDFLKPHYWRLRGKLDVPKERFVSFPGILGQDGTPMIAWAGLDHLQLAKALGDFFGLVQTEYGGSDDPRLVPLLANLAELLPWVRQWNPESLPDYGSPPADFYEQFIQDEATHRSLTLDQIRAWQPPAAARAKKAAKKASKKASKETTPRQPEN